MGLCKRLDVNSSLLPHCDLSERQVWGTAREIKCPEQNIQKSFPVPGPKLRFKYIKYYYLYCRKPYGCAGGEDGVDDKDSRRSSREDEDDDRLDVVGLDDYASSGPGKTHPQLFPITRGKKVFECPARVRSRPSCEHNLTWPSHN